MQKQSLQVKLLDFWKLKKFNDFLKLVNNIEFVIKNYS